MTLRLACFSPLPPQHTGIADYSADLLPYLTQHADVDAFVDHPEQVREDLRELLTVHPIESYAERLWDYDMAIYQMGNSLHHYSTLATALRFPGVLVLHDRTLHHLLASVTAGAGDFSAYWRELTFARGREGADRAWAISRGADTPLFDWSLNKRAMASSLGVLVHSDDLRMRLYRDHPTTPVTKIGQPVPLPQSVPKNELRRKLGLSDDDFVIITCGKITPEKRLDIVAEFYARLYRDHPCTTWLLAGESDDSTAMWLEALATSDHGHTIRRLGYVARLDDLYAYLAAADVCINLRDPSAGETSATALRAMASGTPVVVSDSGWYRELPEACAPRIVHDGDEVNQLYGVIVPWLEDRALCAAAGAAARAYVAETCDPHQVVLGYLRAVQEAIG